MTEHRTEWAEAPAFVEVAEALGIRTDQVAAWVKDGQRSGALWSTDDAPGDAQYTPLHWDDRGILRRSGATRTLPDYFADLFRRLGEDG